MGLMSVNGKKVQKNCHSDEPAALKLILNTLLECEAACS